MKTVLGLKIPTTFKELTQSKLYFNERALMELQYYDKTNSNETYSYFTFVKFDISEDQYQLAWVNIKTHDVAYLSCSFNWQKTHLIEAMRQTIDNWFAYSQNIYDVEESLQIINYRSLINKCFK